MVGISSKEYFNQRSVHVQFPSQIARPSTRDDLVLCQALCFIVLANYLASKQCFHLMIQKNHTRHFNVSSMVRSFETLNLLLYGILDIVKNNVIKQKKLTIGFTTSFILGNFKMYARTVLNLFASFE